MPRPKSKQQLLDASRDNYNKLNELIAAFTKKEMDTPFDFSADEKKKEAHWSRDKNVRDILIHLYEWQKLLLNWVEKNRAGNKVSFLPEPYTFKNIAPMNVEFWEKHQQTSYGEAVKMLDDSHKKVMDTVESFTDEELFTKKYFDWTGSTSLGSYMISATSSHYDWAIKKLKAHKRNCKKL